MRIILLALLVSGCSEVIKGYQAQDAVIRCQPHGGTSYIYRDAWKLHAICQDGTHQYNLGEKDTTK